MTYHLLAITTALSLFLILNVIGAIVCATAWRLVVSYRPDVGASRLANTAFILRVLPVFLAAGVVGFVILPGYYLYEPVQSNEAVTVKLLLMSALSLGFLLSAAGGYIRSLVATRRAVNGWLTGSFEARIAGGDVPVFKVRHPLPVFAVVGIFKPKIFVAERVEQLLTPEEFAATLAHERGHVAARDNLKRTIMMLSRSLVPWPIGRNLDQAWAGLAERAADEFAAGTARTRTDLASALIKLARLVLEKGAPEPFANGSYVVELDGADVTQRVKALIADPPDGNPPLGRHRVPFALPLVLLAAFSTAIFAGSDFLRETHEVVEIFVRSMQ